MENEKPLSRILNVIVSSSLVGALLVAFRAIPVSAAGPTTITSTIIATNFPDVTHVGNAIIPLAVPLLFAAILSMFAMIAGRKGDFFVTLFLLGLFIGSIFGALIAPGNSHGQIPFAEIVVTGTVFILWLWQGSSGQGTET